MIAGRLGRMGVVAGMHVAAFFMIASSLGIISAPKPPDVIQTIPVERPQPRETPPEIPPPTLEPAHDVQLPMPLVDNFDFDLGITADLVEPDLLPPPQETGSAVVEPAIIGPRIDARRPLTQPPYPASDTRLGNEGTAYVEVYVLPNGRVGEARIAKSTGFERLDRSALEEARRNWRLIPATRDGVPIAHWYKVAVTFKITNQ
jgi:periplasmic protein TonB